MVLAIIKLLVAVGVIGAIFFCMLMYLLKAALALASNPTDFIGQSEKLKNIFSFY